MAEPVLPGGDGRAKTALMFGGGLLATIAIVVGLVLLWPSDDGDDDVASTDRTTTSERGSTDGALGEPSERTSTTAGGAEPEEPEAPLNLFEAGVEDAVADMVAAAGDPTEAIGIAVYPTYAFLSYRDPNEPDHIDRRTWRDGSDQDDAAPNPIADRVDEETEIDLFPISEIDLSLLPGLVDDAPRHFRQDVAVTHVLIDRFRPFDRRVLILVYAAPIDGRSGGGYVQYSLKGTWIRTVQ